VRAMKTQLTSIGTTSETIAKALDKLREGVLVWISKAEKELQATS